MTEKYFYFICCINIYLNIKDIITLKIELAISLKVQRYLLKISRRPTYDTLTTLRTSLQGSSKPFLTSVCFNLSSDWIGDDGQKFGGSIYQRISPKLEYGIMVDWNTGGGGGNEGGEEAPPPEEQEAGKGSSYFALGAQYQLDPDASVRVKVDSNMELGVGFQQRIREGKDSNFL